MSRKDRDHDDRHDDKRDKYLTFEMLERLQKSIRLYNGLYRRISREGLRSFATFTDALYDRNAYEEGGESYASEYDLRPLFERYC